MLEYHYFAAEVFALHFAKCLLFSLLQLPNITLFKGVCFQIIFVVHDNGRQS
jgi:hypothetical protein